MFDKKLRKLKDDLLKPFYPILSIFKSPLYITYIGLIFGIISAITSFYSCKTISLIFWILNRLFDGLDGSLARYMNTTSDFGGYIDLICDFMVYCAIPFGSALAHSSLIRIIMNSTAWMVLSTILEKRKRTKESERMTTIEMPEGLIEGTETIIFITGFILSTDTTHVFLTLMGLFTLLVLVTTFQRIHWAYYNLN